VRIPAVPDGPTLAGLVAYLYQDTLPLEAITTLLHTAAVKCGMSRLVALCERRYAERLEQQMALWPGGRWGRGEDSTQGEGMIGSARGLVLCSLASPNATY
jgi:hypothetical protein